MNDRVAWGLLLSGGLPEVAPLPRSKTRIQTKITIIIASMITITIITITTIIAFIKAPSSTITFPYSVTRIQIHWSHHLKEDKFAPKPAAQTMQVIPDLELRYFLTEGRVDQIWVMWSFVILRALKICEGSTAVSCWVPKNGFDGSRQIGLTHSPNSTFDREW